MIKLLLRNFSIFILLFALNTSTLLGNENDTQENLYLKKLNEYEKSQKEIDLIFAEYCYFHTDPICFEEVDNVNEINEKKIDTSELNAQIYYTTTNVNLREEPNTKSKVLSVINKNETVKVYEVSNINPDWFLVKYDNFQGYIYSEYLSKEKQIVSVENNEENNLDSYDLNQVNWSELTNEVFNICSNEYLGIDSYNTKERHNNYCTCYANSFKDIHTEQDILFFLDNDDYSEEFYKKAYQLEDKCSEKYNFIFDDTYDDETKDVIQDQIKVCKSDYEDNSIISKLDYYDWCKCYHNKSFIIFIEDVIENPDGESISKNTEKKLEKLENSCLSEIGN